MWNSLITPQPNKYLEALLPTTQLNRLTRFVIEEEGWYVVEYDHTSVPGIMYVSMTEEKVNSLTDDIKNDLADLDKLAKYSIIVPAEPQCFKVGEEIAPIFTVMKNGSPLYMVTEIVPLDKNMVRREGEKVFGVREGQTKIRIRLKDFPEIFVDEDIKIGLNEEFAAYVAGKASIRLNRTEVYELYSNQEIIGDVSYSLNDDALAAIVNVENNKCYIKANGKNKLGTLILFASYGGKTYEKEIKITPLW